MPGPLSWFFHHLPRGVHRAETAANPFAQLVVPVALFTPQPVAGIAACVVIATQLWLVLSGNFAWLNWLTILLAVAALDGSYAAAPPPAAFVPPPGWYAALVIAATVLVVVLSYWPVRNMLSRGQMMNVSFNRLHLVNSYGAFGSINRMRLEVVVEGTDAAEPGPDAVWKEYGFKGKPTDPHRLPRQFAPYHLRLDWMMWFAGISPAYAWDWFIPFVGKLLTNDPHTLRLLRGNPFPDAPPTYVRARLGRYRFTDWRTLRATGAWWERSLVREYLPPVGLEDLRRHE
jgi:hypothetical protein